MLLAVAHLGYTRTQIFQSSEEASLPAIRTALPVLALATLLLQACASSPTEPQQAAEPEVPPELTLNIPQGDPCACPEIPSYDSSDYTFLEKGITALVAGEYIEAVQYFERYRRIEGSPASDWEAGVAIAYVSMLAESPFHDSETARKSYRKLRKKYGADMEVHEATLMMRDSLETFIGMDRKVDELQEENQRLTRELEKRDEAIRRLRELTLGQKEEVP